MNTPKIASSSNTTALESYSIAQAQQPTDWQNTEAAASGLSAFGTAKPDFALLMVSGIVNTACEENPANRSQPHNNFEAMAALTGIGPRDEIEAMLATQMVATHVAAIKALKQLKGSVNTTQQDSNGNLAVSYCEPLRCNSRPCNGIAARVSRRSQSSTCTSTPVVRQLWVSCTRLQRRNRTDRCDRS